MDTSSVRRNWSSRETVPFPEWAECERFEETDEMSGISNIVNECVHSCRRSRKLPCGDWQPTMPFTVQSSLRPVGTDVLDGCNGAHGPVKMQLWCKRYHRSGRLDVLCLKALPSDLAKVGWMWREWGAGGWCIALIACAVNIYSIACLAMPLLLFFAIYLLFFLTHSTGAWNLSNEPFRWTLPGWRIQRGALKSPAHTTLVLLGWFKLLQFIFYHPTYTNVEIT